MLVIKNLEKSYGKFKALKGVDLEIEKEKYLVLLGQMEQGNLLLWK